MVALNALRQTPSALQRNPIVFVPVLVAMLFQVPQFVVQAIDPLVGTAVSLLLSLAFLVFVPFFQGGIIAMADEALDGQTSLERFVSAGKANYVSLLVAYLLLVGVNSVIFVVGFFLAIFGGVAFYASGTGGPNIILLAALGLLVAVTVLAYLLIVFFIQFYGQAIVIDDYGAIGGLKHSIGTVRQHLVSTLGYSVLVGILGGVAGGVFALGSILATPQSASLVALPELSLGAVAVVALLIAAVGSLFGGFFGVYSVAFYRRITGPDANTTEGA